MSLHDQMTSGFPEMGERNVRFLSGFTECSTPIISNILILDYFHQTLYHMKLKLNKNNDYFIKINILVKLKSYMDLSINIHNNDDDK